MKKVKRLRKIPRDIGSDNDINTTRHQRKLKYLKTRRNIRKLQITLARFRVLLRLIAIVFIFWALIKVVNLPQWYLDKNIFASYPNNYLQLEGNVIVSNNQIINQLSQIKLANKPIYLLNTKLIEKSLLKLSPVKKVYVRRFWFPARLKIVIEEKKPVLSVYFSPKFKPVAVFTEDITIIGKEFLPLKYSGKVFNVITYNDFHKWSSKHVSYITHLSKLLENSSRQRLVYLDIRNPDDVYAQLNNVKLRLGDLDKLIFDRTGRIAPVLPEAMKISNQIDYIDLRWDNSISIKLKNKEQVQKTDKTET